jgi:uncharacterized protein YjbI with pentapeptide repeats
MPPAHPQTITPELPDLESIDFCDAPSTLEDNTTIDHAHLNAPFAQPIHARGIVFDQSKLTNTALMTSTLPSSRWTDCAIETADLSSATWIDARLIRVTITNTKLTGFDARGAELRDVHYKECKAPDMLLTETKLTRVRFDHCQLTSLDLSGATIHSLAINHCDARNLRLIDAKIDHLDLRDSLIESIAISPNQLRHITITPSQAPALARALGVNIIEH